MLGVFKPMSPEDKISYLENRISELLHQIDTLEINYKRKIFELEEEIKRWSTKGKKTLSYTESINEYIESVDKIIDSAVEAHQKKLSDNNLSKKDG